MSNELRVGLAKSQIEARRVVDLASGDPPNKAWPFTSWTEAVATFARNEVEANPRFPVVVSTKENDDDESISPEVLQRVANLPTLPSPRTTNTTNRNGSFTGDEVHIVDIDWDEMKLLKVRSQYKKVFVWFSTTGSQESKPTTAVAIKSVDPDWERRPWVPWGPSSWAAAMEAYSKADLTLDPSHPIVVGGPTMDGPVDSPEALQKLLGLHQVPPTLTTRLTRRAGDWTGEEVELAEIDVFEWKALLLLAEVEQVRVWIPRAEQQRVHATSASVVKAIRKIPLKEGERWSHWGRSEEESFQEESTYRRFGTRS